MRVLIGHDDAGEVQRLIWSAQECWGAPLTRVELIADVRRLSAQLADQRAWPDVILVGVHWLEQQPDMFQTLATHPGHGFYRLLVCSRDSDEFSRAQAQVLGDQVIPEPVTVPKLIAALCQR